MPFRSPAEPTPLPNILESFNAVSDYVQSLGVTPNNVRLRVYQEFLASISHVDYKPIDPDRAIRLWREIHELIWVMTVFKDNEIEPPTDLLKRSFDGKPLDEYDDESGRNYFLELRAAIYLLRVGYEVRLDRECDVVAIRGKNQIFIECKRLYSATKAKARVRKCYKQLEIRLANADRHHKNVGVAWIDPSPAMQKHYFLYTAYSESGARHAARMDLAYFWKKWIANGYEGNERRIIAVILQMVWPSWVAESEGIRTGFTSYVVPGHGKTGFWGLWKARRLLDEILTIEEDS